MPLPAGVVVFLWALSGCGLPGGFPADDPLSRPVRFQKPANPDQLLQKAVALEDLIRRRHLTPEGLLAYGIRLAGPDSDEVVEMGYGDMAIWSGCYVAAEAFRYAVTGAGEVRQDVRRLVQGLHLLQDVTGRKGLLARGVKALDEKQPESGAEWHRGAGSYSGYQWLGDVSVDQVIGVVFGYSAAFDLVPDASLRASIARRVAAIADHLVEHGMQIVDVDGHRTRHGDLSGGRLTEPLNDLIALAVFKAAARMNPIKEYEDHYRSLIGSGYHRRAVRARDPWWEAFAGVNHSDNNLAFLAYYTLMPHEPDPVLAGAYARSLERAWGVVRNEGNPLFTFIYHALRPVQFREEPALRRAIETLRRFPVDRRNHRVANSERGDLCIAFRRDRFGRKQACDPVPIDRRPADPFEWKENPYRLDGGGDGSIEFSGVDYLLPYWMGRFYGFVPAPGVDSAGHVRENSGGL